MSRKLPGCPPSTPAALPVFATNEAVYPAHVCVCVCVCVCQSAPPVDQAVVVGAVVLDLEHADAWDAPLEVELDERGRGRGFGDHHPLLGAGVGACRGPSAPGSAGGGCC